MGNVLTGREMERIDAEPRRYTREMLAAHLDRVRLRLESAGFVDALARVLAWGDYMGLGVAWDGAAVVAEPSPQEHATDASAMESVRSELSQTALGRKALHGVVEPVHSSDWSERCSLPALRPFTYLEGRSLGYEMFFRPVVAERALLSVEASGEVSSVRERSVEVVYKGYLTIEALLADDPLVNPDENGDFPYGPYRGADGSSDECEPLVCEAVEPPAVQATLEMGVEDGEPALVTLTGSVEGAYAAELVLERLEGDGAVPLESFPLGDGTFSLSARVDPGLSLRARVRATDPVTAEITLAKDPAATRRAVLDAGRDAAYARGASRPVRNLLELKGIRVEFADGREPAFFADVYNGGAAVREVSLLFLGAGISAEFRFPSIGAGETAAVPLDVEKLRRKRFATIADSTDAFKVESRCQSMGGRKLGVRTLSGSVCFFYDFAAEMDALVWTDPSSKDSGRVPWDTSVLTGRLANGEARFDGVRYVSPLHYDFGGLACPVRKVATSLRFKGGAAPADFPVRRTATISVDAQSGELDVFFPDGLDVDETVTVENHYGQTWTMLRRLFGRESEVNAMECACGPCHHLDFPAVYPEPEVSSWRVLALGSAGGDAVLARIEASWTVGGPSRIVLLEASLVDALGIPTGGAVPVEGTGGVFDCPLPSDGDYRVQLTARGANGRSASAASSPHPLELAPPDWHIVRHTATALDGGLEYSVRLYLEPRDVFGRVTGIVRLGEAERPFSSERALHLDFTVPASSEAPVAELLCAYGDGDPVQCDTHAVGTECEERMVIGFDGDEPVYGDAVVALRSDVPPVPLLSVRNLAVSVHAARPGYPFYDVDADFTVEQEGDGTPVLAARAAGSGAWGASEPVEVYSEGDGPQVLHTVRHAFGGSKLNLEVTLDYGDFTRTVHSAPVEFPAEGEPDITGVVTGVAGEPYADGAITRHPVTLEWEEGEISKHLADDFRDGLLVKDGPPVLRWSCMGEEGSADAGGAVRVDVLPGIVRATVVQGVFDPAFRDSASGNPARYEVVLARGNVAVVNDAPYNAVTALMPQNAADASVGATDAETLRRLFGETLYRYIPTGGHGDYWGFAGTLCGPTAPSGGEPTSPNPEGFLPALANTGGAALVCNAPAHLEREFGRWLTAGGGDRSRWEEVFGRVNAGAAAVTEWRGGQTIVDGSYMFWACTALGRCRINPSRVEDGTAMFCGAAHLQPDFDVKGFHSLKRASRMFYRAASDGLGVPMDLGDFELSAFEADSMFAYSRLAGSIGLLRAPRLVSARAMFLATPLTRAAVAAPVCRDASYAFAGSRVEELELRDLSSCNNLQSFARGASRLRSLRVHPRALASVRFSAVPRKEPSNAFEAQRDGVCDVPAAYAEGEAYTDGLAKAFSGCRLDMGSLDSLASALPVCRGADGTARVDGIVGIGLDASCVPDGFKGGAAPAGGRFVLPRGFFTDRSGAFDAHGESGRVVDALRAVWEKGWRDIELDWH